MTSFYEKMYKTFQPMVKWVYRVESVDMENVPDCGVILACNHTSFADVLVLSAALKRQVRYMAKKELFNLRFQNATNQLDNTSRIKDVRRNIARIQTVISSKAE